MSSTSSGLAARAPLLPSRTATALAEALESGRRVEIQRSFRFGSGCDPGYKLKVRPANVMVIGKVRQLKVLLEKYNDKLLLRTGNAERGKNLSEQILLNDEFSFPIVKQRVRQARSLTTLGINGFN